MEAQLQTPPMRGLRGNTITGQIRYPNYLQLGCELVVEQSETGYFIYVKEESDLTHDWEIDKSHKLSAVQISRILSIKKYRVGIAYAIRHDLEL